MNACFSPGAKTLSVVSTGRERRCSDTTLHQIALLNAAAAAQTKHAAIVVSPEMSNYPMVGRLVWVILCLNFWRGWQSLVYDVCTILL